MRKEAEKVFEEVISLYDIADELENNGQEKEAIKMREKLNIIGAFITQP